MKLLWINVWITRKDWKAVAMNGDRSAHAFDISQWRAVLPGDCTWEIALKPSPKTGIEREASGEWDQLQSGKK